MNERADALVLFGVTGDLVYKKLLPALQGLAVDDRLPTSSSGSPAQLGTTTVSTNTPEKPSLRGAGATTFATTRPPTASYAG